MSENSTPSQPTETQDISNYMVIESQYCMESKRNIHMFKTSFLSAPMHCQGIVEAEIEKAIQGNQKVADMLLLNPDSVFMIVIVEYQNGLLDPIDLRLLNCIKLKDL